MSGKRSDPKPTVADLLGDYLRQQCETALSIDADLVRTLLRTEQPDEVDLADVEQIHRLRVAYRRIRSVIRVYGDNLDDTESGRLADRARWFAIRLGAVRDLDVLGLRLTAAITALDSDLVLHQPLEELQAQLRYRRTIALAGVRDAMHHQDHADLADQLRSWQQQPPWTTAADRPAARLAKGVARAERRVAKRLTRAAAAIKADDPEADTLIHAVRKAAKQHRYAVEAAAPVLDDAEQILAARRELQDWLGDYQDSVLASSFLRDLGGIPGRNGFTFGLLYAEESHRRRRVRKKLVKRAR